MQTPVTRLLGIEQPVMPAAEIVRRTVDDASRILGR
jgi:hypothetical protein